MNINNYLSLLQHPSTPYKSSSAMEEAVAAASSSSSSLSTLLSSPSMTSSSSGMARASSSSSLTAVGRSQGEKGEWASCDWKLGGLGLREQVKFLE